ncbi:MAG TPA: hypothetical protein VE974_09510 [Thermoanaerobaculia bacterium]|nr:hypothetical protein [Thermoanaerobaculia bacterium]
MDESEASHSTTMSSEKHFVVCVKNDEYEGALELRKIYEVLEDLDAEPHDMIRVVDESGEDYLYPRGWFLPIQLPHNIEEAMAELAHAEARQT